MLKRFPVAVLFLAMFLSLQPLWTVSVYAQNIVEDDRSVIKIGVLYPAEGAASVYLGSLQLAIDAVTAQVAANAALPRVEFIQATLVNDESKNRKAISQLLAEDVVALLSPNLFSAMITAEPGKVDVIPLVARVDVTADLVLVGGNSLYADLADNRAIKNSIDRLKFRGNLEDVILLYDSTDAFGQLGYQIIVERLTEVKTSFSTEVLNSNAGSFLSKLEGIKETLPQSTVIIIARGEEVTDAIFEAHDQVGFEGEILGMLGDGHPTVFDLAETTGQRDALGNGWDIVSSPAMSALVSQQFNSDRFAAETYVAIWALIESTDLTISQPRASVRNTFVKQGANYLDLSTARFAAWWVDAAQNAIIQIGERLSLSQIGQLDRFISTDLE